MSVSKIDSFRLPTDMVGKSGLLFLVLERNKRYYEPQALHSLTLRKMRSLI